MSLRTMYRRRAAAGLAKPVKKYFFNEEFFLEWSSNLAWLLGIIWSDGCLYRNTVEISSKDRQLIDTIATLIDHNVGAVPKNEGRHWRIVLSSKCMADRLRLLGLHPKKSFSIQMPQGLPEMYLGDFMRGVFDGDGSIGLRKTKSRTGQRVEDCMIYICGASEQLKDSIKLWMVTNGVTFNERYRGSCWRLSVFRQASLIKIFTLFYHSENLPSLNRKRDIFVQWFTTPRYQAGGAKGVPRLSSSPESFSHSANV